jgi:hypothetical protein
MKRLVTFFLLFSLCGCFDDQKQQKVEACQVEAMHSYPTHRVLIGGNLGSYIRTCMTAQGYNWATKCEFSNAAASNPDCYVPKGWFARLEELLGRN